MRASAGTGSHARSVVLYAIMGTADVKPWPAAFVVDQGYVLLFLAVFVYKLAALSPEPHPVAEASPKRLNWSVALDAERL